MTGTPAERPDFCPDCGTAPCSHPPHTRSDLAVLVIIAFVFLVLGLLLGLWVAP